MLIDSYKEKYKREIAELILNIQQNEFHIPVTIDDQPDLLDIGIFYCKGNGNFWIALNNDKVIGTIAQIDIGNNQSALRKMFVDEVYRGKEHSVAQSLLDTLIMWCREKGTREIYLGTIDIMKAAHKFYTKNGFVEIEKHQLPGSFPVMKVDNKFFKLTII
jgi:GNAT superfamily N-acetyltransferase